MALVGSHNPKLTALWELDQKQAIRIVTTAMRQYDGDLKATAKALNIGRTTLHRWILQYPELKTSLDKIRQGAKKTRRGAT